MVGMALRVFFGVALCAVVLVPACGKVAAPVLAGVWKEAGATKHGHVLEFDSGSDKFLLHGPGDDHGSHDPFAGTFQVEGAEVVLRGVWESNGKAEVVRGRFEGDLLYMAFAPQAIRFVRKER
jgi:hypothetical protein